MYVVKSFEKGASIYTKITNGRRNKSKCIFKKSLYMCSRNLKRFHGLLVENEKNICFYHIDSKNISNDKCMIIYTRFVFRIPFHRVK